MHPRPPAVAGLFYPSREDELRSEVLALLARARVAKDSDSRQAVLPAGLVLPHAGYRYSGPVAACGYCLLEPLRQRIRRVLVLGPAHRAWLAGMALPEADALLTPLGAVAVDAEAVAVAAGMTGVVVSDLPHAREHSIEVQIPFLQTVLEDFRIVPVVVGECEPEPVADLIDRLWAGEETLLVVSSDLSHFLSYADARRVDGETCGRILARRGDLGPEEACGARALNGLLNSRRARSLALELLDLRNSGDTAGAKDRVVGYAAFVLH